MCNCFVRGKRSVGLSAGQPLEHFGHHWHSRSAANQKHSINFRPTQLCLTKNELSRRFCSIQQVGCQPFELGAGYIQLHPSSSVKAGNYNGRSLRECVLCLLHIMPKLCAIVRVTRGSALNASTNFSAKWLISRSSKSRPPSWTSPSVANVRNVWPSISKTVTSNVPPPRS